ncbi:zinc finger BED domain-containing 1-like protein [Labeo rohita]|uniref:Zinc finger BED domain-containing 1-like protein n=1 Tax=Labeo rohita TaxID=84645 RepID=A0A498MEN8_LABRO|nr:zinc finger BED domain-containing 1-like protein [Labeo rohita]
MGCSAHTINLTSQAALKLSGISWSSRVRHIVTFLHRSANADKVFKEKQMLLNLPCRKLKTDVVTRWISARDVLDRFLEQQPLLSPEVRRREKDLCTLTEEDITVAEDIVKALQPMKSATLVMSGENTATLSVNAPLHTQILDETRSSDRDSAVFKELRSAMQDNLKCENLKEKLHVASALDPRFKSVPFISEEEQDDTFTSLISEMVTLEQVKAHDQECDSAGNGGSKTSPPQPRQTGQNNPVRCRICSLQPMHQWLKQSLLLLQTGHGKKLANTETLHLYLSQKIH